jgi:hypothetical protein
MCAARMTVAACDARDAAVICRVAWQQCNIRVNNADIEYTAIADFIDRHFSAISLHTRASVSVAPALELMRGEHMCRPSVAHHES